MPLLFKTRIICSFCFYFILFSSSLVVAQNNLVPNWSFENVQNFPPPCSSVATINYAVGWVNPNNGTSCVFNIDSLICSSYGYPEFGVPQNFGGWQYAHSGKGYGNIQVLGFGNSISNTNVREYIQSKLIDSLRNSKTYCISFYVSLMDSFSNYATSRIGCYLSNVAINNYSQELLSYSPQIENPYNHFITNKTDWTEIKGLYTSNGSEQYITIGNFYDDINTDTVFTPGMGINWCCAPNNYLSAYYIDDISIVEYNNAYAGNDTNICKGAGVILGNNVLQTFGATYNWQVLVGDSGSLVVNDSFRINVKPNKTTTYVLQKQQCGIISYDTLTVHVPVNYQANAGRDTTICIGDSAQIGVNTCQWCNYTWQVVNNASMHTPVLIVSPSVNTTYTLNLQDSCFTTTSTVNIHTEYCQSPVITVPNIFTPNNDEVNDVWALQIQNELSILNYQCALYNRWGTKVFETDNPSAYWDGHTTSGLACQAGTYFYIIAYTDAKTNQNKTLKGFIEMVK